MTIEFPRQPVPEMDRTSPGRTPLNNISGVFLPHIGEYFEELGGDSAALWDRAGLEKQSFNPLQDKISEEQLHQFIGTVAQHAGSEFGFELGMRINIASFGMLSRAIISSGNLRSSTSIVSRYSELTNPLVRVSGSDTSDGFVVELAPSSRYPDLNRVLVESVVANMQRAFELLAATKLEVEHACFAFADPGYSKSRIASIARRVTFGAEQNLFYLSRRIAERPFLTASQTDEKLTLEQCEEELAKTRHAMTVADQVCEQLRAQLEAGPTSLDVAKRMNMSERSLRRLLAADGTSFRELLKRVREERARYYLAQTNLNVAQVATKLGYVETSNFRAAFKAWTGQTPSAWRKHNAADG